MRHKQVDARKADFAWRKVTTVEQGRILIEQAEADVKKSASKLKTLGHKLTATRTSGDVKTPLNRTSGDIWKGRLGHAVTHGKNPESLASMRVSEVFLGDADFAIHRTFDMPPIHIATPNSESESDSDREAVPEAVTRKAAKYLATLPRGAHDADVIQAGRAAGLSVEQLSAWADQQTVSKALAAGNRHWRELWTLTIEHTSLEGQA
jgi:hypothetical protein